MSTVIFSCQYLNQVEVLANQGTFSLQLSSSMKVSTFFFFSSESRENAFNSVLSKVFCFFKNITTLTILYAVYRPMQIKFNISFMHSFGIARNKCLKTQFPYLIKFWKNSLPRVALVICSNHFSQRYGSSDVI